MLCVECGWFHHASLLFVSLLVFLRRERFISCSEQIETIPTHSMKDGCLMNGWFLNGFLFEKKNQKRCSVICPCCLTQFTRIHSFLLCLIPFLVSLLVWRKQEKKPEEKQEFERNRTMKSETMSKKRTEKRRTRRQRKGKKRKERREE